MARLVTKFKYLKPDQDFTKASMCGRVHAYLIIPGLFEPPVRTFRATIPENESHIFR